MKKILALDPGSKKTGLAISDRTQTIGFCFDTLKTDEDLNSKLKSIIESEKVGLIILGKNLYPSKHFNSSQWSEVYCKDLGVDIVEVNEDYSTFRALELNPDADKDQAAAQYILQNYLDEKNGSRNGI
jgi:RNase H-fold protein (predicted Holliday junction resolvase)